MSEAIRPPSTPLQGEILPLAPLRPAPRRSGSRLRYLGWAAGLVAVFGLGAVGTHAAQWALARVGRATVQAEATAQTMRQLQAEVGRLKASVDTMRSAADTRQDDSLRTLKRSVEALKGDLQQARAADGAALQGIAAKLDKPDPAARLAEIAARLDRIEQAAKPSDVAAGKLVDVTARLDRIERDVAASQATGSIPPPVKPVASGTTTVTRAVPTPPVKPAAGAEAKTPAHTSLLDAWVVREVHNGLALVEARRGGLREVAPGEFLPGAGQIRSIERRGRTWVVLTSRGVIEASTF